MRPTFTLLAVAWFVTLFHTPLQAADLQAPSPALAGRVIVKLRAESALLREHALAKGLPASAVAAMAQRRADAFGQRLGHGLRSGRMLGVRSQVLMSNTQDGATLAARLSKHADVEWAVEDRRMYLHAAPNDPLFASGAADGRGPASGQWYLRPPDATLQSAINAEAAWDRVNPDPALVVAVLDTGVLADHLDLLGRVLPGYDMVSGNAAANDGNGRDGDASDPGDYVTAAEDGNRRGAFYQCGTSNSSWHGTKVAGIIGAAANNGIGMAGIASGVRILPVRVLGKCGGFVSDIVAGMYWAVGHEQPGLPNNPNPARVLNMSLGGDGSCSAAYREAFATVTAAPYDAVVVVAAGNSTGLAVGTPANCPGAVAVVGLRHAGSKVGFSDLGPEVAIAAPGGNCVNTTAGSPCLYPILTSSNSGTQGPNAGGSIWTDSYKITVGTSFSAPIVSGVVALMLSARPQLTAAEVLAALRRSARPFPTTGADNGDGTVVPVCRAPSSVEQLQCYCTTAVCGAGMVDAAAAVQGVQQGLALVDGADQLLDFGEARYANFFPGRVASASSPPFRYRYYPATGAYLGVVVNSDGQYLLNGVYVLGGPFGNTPRYVGQVGDFINLKTSAQAAERAGQNGLR